MVTSVKENNESAYSDQSCAKTDGVSLCEIESDYLLYPNPIENHLVIRSEMHINEVSIYSISGVLIGKYNNIEVICILTNMDVPLGNNIGNSLEVEEAIEILKDYLDTCMRLPMTKNVRSLNLSNTVKIILKSDSEQSLIIFLKLLH